MRKDCSDVSLPYHGGPLDTEAVDEAEEAETGRGQDPHGVRGRVALREKRLENVESECETLYCSDAGSEDDTFYPHPDEGQKGTECEMNVGVVSSRLLYHTAQLGIAVSSW